MGAGTYVGLKVEGGRRLRATLKKAGDDLTDLKGVHRQVSEIVVRKARANVPVVSGRLQATIRPGATKRAAIIRSGKKKVPYANPIHWGWKARHIKKNPYLSNAAQQTESTWVEVYQTYVQKRLDEVHGV